MNGRGCGVLRGGLSIGLGMLIVITNILWLFELASVGKPGFLLALVFIFLLFIVSSLVLGFDITCLALVGLAWVFWYHLKD